MDYTGAASSRRRSGPDIDPATQHGKRIANGRNALRHFDLEKPQANPGGQPRRGPALC
jgi:hypothetical protein